MQLCKSFKLNLREPPVTSHTSWVEALTIKRMADLGFYFQQDAFSLAVNTQVPHGHKLLAENNQCLSLQAVRLSLSS